MKDEIRYQKLELKTDNKGQPTGFTMEMDKRNALLFMAKIQIIPNLASLAESQQDDAIRQQLLDHLQELKEIVQLLESSVPALDIIKKGKKINFRYKVAVKQGEDPEAIGAAVQKGLKNYYISHCVKMIMEVEGGILAPAKDHKQSRALARTVAISTGKDTKQPSLFEGTLQDLKLQITKQLEQSPALIKNKMSQKTGILAQNLLWKYDELPKDDDGNVRINNVSQLADELQTSLQELKIMLFYLGGFQYTHVVHFSERREIGLQLSKLFDIMFMYDEKVAGNFDPSEVTSVGRLHLLQNERLKAIKVRPTAEFIRDLKGDGRKALGYFRANDGFIAALLKLSQLAYKIMNFSIANKPAYTIGEDKLFENLGIQEQVKKQGRPRIQKQVDEALQELKDKGHFLKYEIKQKDGKNMYSWNYTDKYVKHQDKLPKETDEFIDYKDKSIPVEKRRQRLQQFMMKTKKMTAGRAMQLAIKKLPD